MYPEGSCFWINTAKSNYGPGYTFGFVDEPVDGTPLELDARVDAKTALYETS